MDYEYYDEFSGDQQEESNSVGRRVDKRIKQIRGYVDEDELDELEFEEEIDTFERFTRRGARR